MSDMLERTKYLLGEAGVERLMSKKVAIFGVGGVGGYTAEALARSGVGEITLIDKDTVSESNINRQIVALHSTVGSYKVDVMAARMKDINPDIKVNTLKMFFLPENSDEIDFNSFDYIVDAVDTVTAKIEIIVKAKKAGVPVISSMGAGNKLDPTKFTVTDIYKTEMCPLARVMRREMKKRNVESLKVVYSTEQALSPVYPEGVLKETDGKRVKLPPGSIAFVPSVAGLIVAGEVIKDLVGGDL